MSLNFEKMGATIAIIKNNESLKNKVISVSPDTGTQNYKTYDTFDLTNGNFQPIGDYNKERTVNYVVGASGSGKSYYICEWVKEYKKKYKKNPIYLFSSLSSDETLDTIKPQRVILDATFLNEDIDLELYRDSCCIFDDCDTINDKKIKNKVYTLMNAVLNTGRHFNITVWSVNHTPTGNKTETKTILNEAHTLVYFPINMNRQLLYLLENYSSLDKKAINSIRKLNSRWVCIYKQYPQVVITDKKIIMMNVLVD